MKSAPQSSDGDKESVGQRKPGDAQQAQQDQHAEQADPHAPKHPRSLQESAAPLPHESDQSAESQQEQEPRPIGQQAHGDIERGLVDTDRRGGGDYQQMTQNDAHADVNSDQKQPDQKEADQKQADQKPAGSTPDGGKPAAQRHSREQ
jgi:hypothetical protein